MAAEQNVPQLGGYDYEFTGRVPHDYECLVCHLPMKDPVQIVQCGHKLCNICKESLFRLPSPFCPADRQPLSREQIFPDTACRRKILDLTVKCFHSGCLWTGELREVEEHQSNCLLKVVQCPNSRCTEKVTRQDMGNHMASECSWRIIYCGYCQKLIVFNQQKKHFDICQKFPVHCTNKCGLEEIPRGKLEFHIGEDCPATEVYCEFKKLGCDVKFPRSNTKAHLETHIEQHLNLALRSLETTQRQVKDQSQQIEQLMAKDKDLSQQIERLTAQVKVQDQHIKLLNSPPFVWKISNFQAAYEKALSGKENILTSTFYLSSNGYRLRIQIFSNAYRMRWFPDDFLSSTTYFSFYICVIPGEFDPLLSWPFKEKLRVTLINQNPCEDKEKDIWRVTDFGRVDLPIMRPLTEDNQSCHGVLGPIRADTLQSASFTLNDTIFIMVKKE